jgi:hypothetical protein
MPAIIAAAGRQPVTRVLDHAGFLEYVDQAR